MGITSTRVIAGRVIDPSGSAIPGARVALKPDNDSSRSTLTDSSGHFSFEIPDFEHAELMATQKGFAPATVSFNARDQTDRLEIELSLATLADAVVVTATRGRHSTSVAENAASVTVIEGGRLLSAAEGTVDEVLRARIPGFSLFRRTSSLTANPTSQGVSLRATGASGASRTAVMDDGVPAGDPFGGWIYWSRLPRARIGSIDVIRGSTSDEFGSSAIGGVIGIEPRIITPRTLIADFSAGALNSAGLSLFAAHSTADATQTVASWGGSIAVDSATSEGYILVAPAERGPVDEAAGGWHRTIEVTAEHRVSEGGFFGSGARLFLRGQIFGEHRQNGTPLQRNSTVSRLLVFGGESVDRFGDAWRLRIYGGNQGYDQSFSGINSSRARESLSRLQRVPARQKGASLVWSRALTDRLLAGAGVEARQVRGFSDEIIYDASGRPTTNTIAGGVQETLAGSGNLEVAVSKVLKVTASARLDGWRNRDGSTTSRPLPAGTVAKVINHPDKQETAFSPRLSAVFSPQDRLSFRASVGRSFRAPTLNELYRDFRVGNILTLSNPALAAERSATGEGGVLWISPNRHLAVRATAFITSIRDPVANVTLSETSALITRQRRNLGRTHSRGLETEAEYRLGDSWTLTASYLLADATVRQFPADPSLLGLRVPQIPRHSLTWEARYASPRFLNIGLAARYISDAFEDDRNLLRLGPYLVADLYVSRPLEHGLEAFIAAENLFDREYPTGRTPATTIGTPRLVRAGLKFRLPESQ
ncbi:MAG TPA: TonB-dependent receptor [Acidobacteriota bacterium]|nr:TonB-dependent receptor [Acidobacteriota bacterium]